MNPKHWAILNDSDNFMYKPYNHQYQWLYFNSYPVEMTYNNQALKVEENNCSITSNYVLMPI